MSQKRKDNKGRILRDGESQRSDGRYMYRYFDLLGKRHSAYDIDLNSLREKEKQIQKDIEDGIDIAGGTKTLNEQFDRYMKTKVKISAATKDAYLDAWNRSVRKDKLGNMQIANIKKSDILFFYNDLVINKGYKKGTLAILHNLIRPCLELAVDDDAIRKNPAKGCMKSIDAKEGTKRKALTIRQQEIFLDFVENNNVYKFYYPMFVAMFGTACRIGEIVGLTRKDIDMKNRTIDINHQVNYKKTNNKYGYFAQSPKTHAGIRTIPMTDAVYKALIAQQKNLLASGVNRTYEVDGYKDFIFLTKKGVPVPPNYINHILYRITDIYNEKEVEKAKAEKREPELLPHISAHILRHTGCTRMAEAGIDIKTLQYIMGHEDIKITMNIYNHVDMNRVGEEIKKMDRYKEA